MRILYSAEWGEAHVSLFDSVQYDLEASPGRQDSFYLFGRFVGALAK
jgi:carbamoylphosphate synthase small subunit